MLHDSVDEIKALVSQGHDNSEKKQDEGKDQTWEVVLKKVDERRRLLWAPWCLGSSWAAIGVNGSLIPTEYGRYWDYCLAMQLCLPLAQSVLPYAFLMSLSVRTFPQCPGKFKFLEGGNITFARVLRDDDAFILACKDGDIDAVRVMLRNGQGRATDIVAKNWNPLAVSQASSWCTI